jgi:tripartite ATP-independent transporter DctM subunit
MILYSIVSDVSIARLFLAGYVPGIGYGLCLMAVAFVIARKHRYPTHEKFSTANVLYRLNRTWVALLIPATIIFGIVGGAFTPTEASSITVALALFAALFIYRGMKIRDIPNCLVVSARRSANVLLLLSISSVFSHYLITEGVPQMMAGMIMSWGLAPWAVVLVIFIFLVFCGTFLHGSPIILMLVPIFLPLVDQIGMDRVHFGMFFIFCVVIGEQTPPVASVLLTTCGIANYPITRAWTASLPFFYMRSHTRSQLPTYRKFPCFYHGSFSADRNDTTLNCAPEATSPSGATQVTVSCITLRKGMKLQKIT